MNHVYKVVWNDVQCVWQCVSELTRSHSKKSQRERQERIASVQTQPTSFSQRVVMVALAAILGGVMACPSALAATNGDNGVDQGNVLYHIDGSGNVNKAARDEFARVYKIVNPLSNNYAADGQAGSDGESGDDGASYTVVPSQAQTVFHVSVEQDGGEISATQPARDGGNGANGTDGGNGGNGAKGSSHSEDGRTQTMYTNNMSSNEIQTAVNFLGKTFKQLKQEYAAEQQNPDPDTLAEVVKLEAYAPDNPNWAGFVFHGGRGGNGGSGGAGGNGGAGGQGEQGQTGVAIERGLTVGIYGGTISGGTGGRGGNGGTGGRGGNGGNGGQGGMGATIEIGGTHTNGLYTIKDSGGLEGGKGGNAGSAGTAGAGGNGGNGGNGGVGVYVDGATFITSSTITGGAGGSGGQAGSSGGAGSAGQAGQGGKNGWVGLRVSSTDAGNAANGESAPANPSTPGTTPTAGQEGRGGSAVLLDHEATLVLESGAQLIGGSGSTRGKAIEANGGGNKVQLNTELSNVTLTGGVSGSGNILLLKGADGQTYTISEAQIRRMFNQDFFAHLKKDGKSEWILMGGLSDVISDDAELLAGTTEFASDTSFDKTVTVKNAATIVVNRKSALDDVVLQDSATLETNHSELDGSGIYRLKVDVIPNSQVTLKTTDNFTSSAKVNAFENWTLVAGTSTADGANQLAKGTTSVENGSELTVKNVTLGRDQTLTKKTTGTLTFEGESNFDNGTLTIAGNDAQFSASGAVLVTNKTSGDGIQNNLFGVNSPVTIGNKDKAKLRTMGQFEAKDGFANQFQTWEVQGGDANHRSTATGANQLAKETTDIKLGGFLTLTDVTLSEGQKLALSGGDLTFAGLTNLDQGTKTFTSGNFSFDSGATLETQKKSLSELFGDGLSLMQPSQEATLQTKGTEFTSSTEVANFGTWKVLSGSRENPSTATKSEQLAKTTDVQSGGFLKITNLTLDASQTLALTGGDLTFAGTTNLDQGTKTFTSGRYRFADQAVLETALGSLSAVLGNNPSAMLDSPNATLRTKGPTFTSSAYVAKFGTWKVQGAATTATGADQLAKVTDVQADGVMTITNLTLGSTQTLKLTGGKLTFAGLTNLDEGTKAFDSGKYGFADQAVLETTKASLSDVLGNVNAMETSARATLRTKGEAFTSSADVTKFGTWEVQGAATTATEADQLAKTTNVQSGGDLTVTDLTLVAGKTLKNTGGTLTLEGTTNVDEGTLVLQSGTTKLASGATLVTNQPNADAIQSGAVRSLANRENATLQNDSTFESTGGFAGSFGNWLVNANAKTDSLALYGTELAENVQLDATAMNFIDRVVATNTGSSLTLNDARVVQGAVTGSGSLVKTGSGTLVLEKGNHRYTGTTEVQSGTLVLEKGANLAGDLTMASGSTLELSLLETNREAASRARRLRRALAEEMAPSANHTVAGAATLANTAITVASPTEYSQLAAESITIANGATLTIDARDFKGGTDRLENVLKATSDFTGEYASFSDNSLVFVLTPEYDPANHAMHLAVRPDTGAPEVQPGLSGKTNRMLLEGAMLMQRYLPLDPCMGQTRSSWAHALGGWEQQDGRADRAGYDATHYGVAAGGDVCVNRTKVGLNVAYLSSDAKSRNIAQTHNVNADTWQVGVYAIQPVADAWDVDAEAAYGHSSIRTDRVIASFGKLARSKTSADIFRAGLGLNYRFSQDALSLSPFVRADYVQVGTHGYREWNAEAFNLTVNRQSTKAIYASVGLRALYTPTERLTVKGKVAVAADLYNEGNDLTVAVRDAQDKPFTVQNPELGRFVGELGLGVGYQLNDRVSFSVDLQSLAGHDRWNVNAEAGVRVEF